MNFLSNFPSAAFPLTVIEILVNIGLAFVLGIIITTVYRLTNRHHAINLSFYLTLIILSMVVAMVMIIIGNNIARAFGLVGALSIIRFRTVVKDNRDIAYVFFALVAGMAAGIGNYPLAIYGTGSIAALLLFLDFIRYGTSSSGVFLLRFRMAPDDADLGSVEAILDQYLTNIKKISVKTVRMGQFVEYSYAVRIKKESQLKTFIETLSAIEGMERVNMLANDEVPEE